jgi:hypothetical protein
MDFLGMLYENFKITLYNILRNRKERKNIVWRGHNDPNARAQIQNVSCTASVKSVGQVMVEDLLTVGLVTLERK